MITRYLPTLLISLMLSAVPAAVQADKSKVMVYLDERGCPLYTRTDEDNCDDEQGHRENRSCRKKGERIWWEVSDKSFADQIELRWDKGTANPLTDCNLKASGGKITRCRIDADPGNYDYTVFVREDCKLDPRIIVR